VLSLFAITVLLFVLRFLGLLGLAQTFVGWQSSRCLARS
jgi:hypothetical protein